MPCNRPGLTDYLTNFTGQDPINAVACPFAQEAGNGLGLGLPVFATFLFGVIGLGLTVRTQHPGPLLVAGILSIGAISSSIVGDAAGIIALVFVMILAAMIIYVYQNAKNKL